MSFPPYPAYRPNSVPWLGALPEEWSAARVKDTTYLKGRVGWKGLTSDEYLENGFAYLITGTDFDRQFIRLEDCHFVDQTRYEDDPFIQLRPGDLLITKDGTIGKVALVPNLDRPACLNSGIFLVRPLHSYSADFLYWVLNSKVFHDFCELVSVGSTIQHLYQNVFERFVFPVPTNEDQRSIVSFLNRETGKIDALVAEQGRLIDLLAEQRQTVVSHAVTRGLNPDAPMKRSGVEWLGDVPAHWTIQSVKRLAAAGAKNFTDGDWIEAPFIVTEGVRLIQTGNVGSGVYKEQGFRYVSSRTFDELRCTEVRPRDVLVCRLDGPVGRACLAPNLGVRMITSVDNTILKCRVDVLPDYAVALFTSTQWLSWIEALCRVGGGFRLRVSRTQLGEQRVAIPPFQEQVALAKHIERETQKCDRLMNEAARAIALLEEHRKAVISAAVTGQIDVRRLSGVEVA